MRLAGFLLCSASITAFCQTPSAWTPEFSARFQTVGKVIPSPDGKWVAWTQSKPVIDTERSETSTQIYLAAADGSKRIQLTRGEKNCTGPSFSPDGQWIYFTSDRSGKNNVFRIRAAGGEAEQLTDFKGALEGYEVAPGGKWIAFTGNEPPADLEKSKKEKRDLRVVDADPLNATLYLIPAEADADGKRAQKKLVDAKYHIAGFDWAPDSRAIAFEHQPTPQADNWTRGDIAEVEVESGKVREIAATPAAESQPHYSPDGRYLAYVRSPIPVRWAGDNRIVLLTREGGEARELPTTNDAQPGIVGWTGDSRRIFFVEDKRTRRALFAMPVDGPPQVVYEPARGTLGFAVSANRGGSSMGFSAQTPDTPQEAYILNVSGGAPVQVSRANRDIALPLIGKTEAIRWKSKDGLEIEGLLTYPANYETGKRYPLILNIHGGPTGVYGETFIGGFGPYPIAALAERGFAVLRPNPRGSGGYGKDFRFANYNDWGGRDYEDDQAGVDKVIEMGVADPDRLGIMGWSYGGFMTSWTITQTNRFKAAAIGAGVTDLWSFTGTSDIPGFIPDYFGGEPWAAFTSWTKHSPITYIKNVKTPTLLLHGEADERVPVSQGYEYYNALKHQGALAKMVVYPRQHHGPNEPKFIMDIMQRHIDWMEKYVR
jgi:dipeptidyl aminopeptidase/acylaminoacyl peptidase